MRDNIVFIEGARTILRPLAEEDFTPRYLSWLNDPETNAFSQRRPFPVGSGRIRAYNDYYVEHPESGFVLAIIDKEQTCHIGNVSLVNIQPINRCAEIAILIGDTTYWNKGYAAEVIYLVTKHAFEAMNLHRVFAGTFNPAFVRCVEKLGWKREGEFRERIWSQGRYHNQIWLGILRSEFKLIDKFEAPGNTFGIHPGTGDAV